EGDAVRTIEAGDENLDLPLAVLVDDRIDLVDEAAADEHGALVAQRHRTCVRHAGGIDLDVEAGRHLEFCGRQLDRRRRNRRWCNRRKLGGGLIARRTSEQWRARRKRSGGGCGAGGRRTCSRWTCSRRTGGRLPGGGTQRKFTEESTGQQQAARRRRITHYDVL